MGWKSLIALSFAAGGLSVLVSIEFLRISSDWLFGFFGILCLLYVAAIAVRESGNQPKNECSDDTKGSSQEVAVSRPPMIGVERRSNQNQKSPNSNESGEDDYYGGRQAPTSAQPYLLNLEICVFCFRSRVVGSSSSYGMVG